MATTTELVAEIATTTNAATYNFGAVTPSANSLITVFARATATVLGAVADTGALLTWTQRYFEAPGACFVIYTAPVGGSPASITIRYDCTGDDATGCNAVAYQTTGYKTSDPIAQIASDAGGDAGGTTPTVTFGLGRNTLNTTLGVVFNVTNPAGITVPSGWAAEIADTGYSTPASGMEATFRDGGETATTVTWGSTSASTWRAFAIEINDSTIPDGHPYRKRTGGIPFMGNLGVWRSLTSGLLIPKRPIFA